MTCKIAIIGATSSIAEHCARLWVNQPKVSRLVLVGRDAAKLEIVASDLSVRNPTVLIEVLAGDMVNPESITELIAQSCNDGIPDTVLIAHGSLPDQANCQKSLLVVNDAINVNAVSPVLFAEGYVERMTQRNSGVVAVIGSVAGDRGRKSNYVYGAAKGLVERYMQGLQHRLDKTAITTILIKPGPTDTPMTTAMKAKGLKMASASSVANDIVGGIAKKKSVIYTPGKWKYIMLVIKHLPRFIFNKMDI